jgi:hypothetical protein
MMTKHQMVGGPTKQVPATKSDAPASVLTRRILESNLFGDGPKCHVAQAFYVLIVFRLASVSEPKT